MKKVAASVLIAVFFASGCTGSFNLTRKVYNFHRSQTDKWTDELLFLVVAITPIYGLATFADAIVFNSIEFWTGENPIGMASEKPQTRIVENGKDKYEMAYDAKTDQIYLTSLTTQEKQIVVFERSDRMITAKNDKGEVLYSSSQNEKGDITLYDGNGKLIKNYPAGQIAMLKEKYSEQR